jgi:membrane protease subunit HflC
MSPRMNLMGAIFATVLVVLAMSIFTVDQRQYALVFQLGEVKQVITEPGLYFKMADDPERALFREAHHHAG